MPDSINALAFNWSRRRRSRRTVVRLDLFSSQSPRSTSTSPQRDPAPSPQHAANRLPAL